jgi:hypothetical protein
VANGNSYNVSVTPSDAQLDQPVPRIATARWGEDEFFGGVAVAAVFVDPQRTRALAGLKALENWSRLTLREAEVLAGQVERIVPADRLLIEPARYNKAYSGKGGSGELMQWAHRRVCEQLLARFPASQIVLCRVPGDGPPERLTLDSGVPTVSPGAGFEDVALEAAGALARWVYLDRRVALGQKMGLCLEGDDRQVGAGILRSHGEAVLRQVAKIHQPTGNDLLTGGKV